MGTLCADDDKQKKICVSVEVSVGSEECATSVFLCQGSLRFLLEKQAADLLRTTQMLRKITPCSKIRSVFFYVAVHAAPSAVQSMHRLSGIMSVF